MSPTAKRDIIDGFERYMPNAVDCFRRWVEDGGERDGLPIRQNLLSMYRVSGHDESRLFYRINTMQVVYELYFAYGSLPKETNIPDRRPALRSMAPWIRANVAKWPERLRDTSLYTLAIMKDREALPLLQKEARRAGDKARQHRLWMALAILDPPSVSQVLEPLVGENVEDLRILYDAIDGIDNTTVNQRAMEIAKKIKAIESQKSQE
ncbi:MAG: hypothetical protein LC778_16865 [Acidobacteria bacterium]|nr:hypothetical protein [Acidobacteriota bacterium]